MHQVEQVKRYTIQPWRAKNENDASTDGSEFKIEGDDPDDQLVQSNKIELSFSSEAYGGRADSLTAVHVTLVAAVKGLRVVPTPPLPKKMPKKLKKKVEGLKYPKSWQMMTKVNETRVIDERGTYLGVHSHVSNRALKYETRIAKQALALALGEVSGYTASRYVSSVYRYLLVCDEEFGEMMKLHLPDEYYHELNLMLAEAVWDSDIKLAELALKAGAPLFNQVYRDWSYSVERMVAVALSHSDDAAIDWLFEKMGKDGLTDEGVIRGLYSYLESSTFDDFNTHAFEVMLRAGYKITPIDSRSSLMWWRFSPRQYDLLHEMGLPAPKDEEARSIIANNAELALHLNEQKAIDLTAKDWRLYLVNKGATALVEWLFNTGVTQYDIGGLIRRITSKDVRSDQVPNLVTLLERAIKGIPGGYVPSGDEARLLHNVGTAYKRQYLLKISRAGLIADELQSTH